MAGRIEQRAQLRHESAPDDAVVVVRGGPDAVAKLRRHAERTARAWTLDGDALEGISVFAALDEAGSASLDGLLAAMRSYRVVHLCRVGALREAGFVLLATATRPHFTVWSGAGSLEVEALFGVLGDAVPNPFFQRHIDRETR